VENVSMSLKCLPLKKQIGLTAYKLGSFDPLFVSVHTVYSRSFKVLVGYGNIMLEQYKAE
jgi:hypothetical protein